MKRILMLLMLAAAVPAHAQSKPVQKWEYGEFQWQRTPDYTSNVVAWTVGDSTVVELSLKDLFFKITKATDAKSFHAFFDWLGKQGWEMISCTDEPATIKGNPYMIRECWFKRPKVN